MGRVRFALAGCGRISERHVRAIAAADAELVAVCDPVEARARATAAAAGVPCFPSLAELVSAAPRLDVVCVLTPSGDHADRTIEALAAGCHVLVEKPMALTVVDGERMIQAADAAGRRLFVVQQNRFNRPVVEARRLYEAGAFGRLVMGTVRVRWCRTQAYYDLDAWRGTRRWDGGVLANQANHHVDLLRWFLGEPTRVYAVGRTALAAIETPDTAAAVVEFKGGAIGIIEATTATRPRDLEGSLSLLGERGSVVIGGFAVSQATAWQFEGEVHDRVIEAGPPATDVYGSGHRQVVAEVCEAVRTGRPTSFEGREGLETVRLVEALDRSIATGSPVGLTPP
jgi:predicted dehydrogenase